MRAFLFANATITSIGGLRANIRPSQESGGAPLRLAHRTTPLAAMISRRLSVRSPNRDAFETYIQKVLVPELRPGDIIVMHTCRATRGRACVR